MTSIMKAIPPEQIAQEFPGVSLETVYAVLTYYLHNKSEVDEYLDRLSAWTEKQIKIDDPTFRTSDRQVID